MTGRYFDRNGAPITAEEWARLMEDVEYRRIACDDLPDGGRLSTVWLGLPNLGYGPPSVFETMLFDADDKSLDCWRTTTEAEARQRHLEVLH